MRRERIETEVQEDLLGITASARFLDTSNYYIRKYLECGLLTNVGDGDSTKISRAELEKLKEEQARQKEWEPPFGSLALDLDESCKFLDSFFNPRKPFSDPKIYQTVHQYAITNKGRVLNLTDGVEVCQSVASHGYLQVGLIRSHDIKRARVHVLVAYTWCQNVKFKPEVHHIDGNKTNNNATNLIFLTKQEHRKADRLRREAQKCGNYTEYNSFIAKMQEDNRWDRDMRCVVHPEDNGEMSRFFYITASAYDDLNSGKRTWNEIIRDQEIILECWRTDTYKTKSPVKGNAD